MKGWESNDGNSSGSEGERRERTSREEEPRLFCISINVCSFKATQHLPMRSVNLFVRVVLPEIVRAAVEASELPSQITASLRTHPPVLVERGTEVTISNGYVTLKLPASPIAMIAMLALEPEVKAYILHRDKYAADSVLGVATLPMKLLMEQPVMDGYAPVLGPCKAGEKVKIGSLRVVLAIEDIGAVVSSEPVKFRIGAPPGPARQPRSDDLTAAKRNAVFAAERSHVKAAPDVMVQNPAEEEEPGEVVMQAINSSSESPCNKRRKSVSASWKTASPKTSKSDAEGHMKAKAATCEEDIRRLPEYEMAWEFEMWRRSEEARWLKEFKQREEARMSELEADWRKKENQRVAEMRNFQSVQAEMEAKLRSTLLKLEKRERSVNVAEEGVERRKEALERAYANRTSDAQVAVKRLEAECEHRLELERSKLIALQEQYAVLEQRLATSNSSLSNLEKQFQDYKSALRNTKESDLLGQIFGLKQQCCNLERKFELAIHSRDDYKSQVMKMAKELAKLHRIREAQRHQATEDRLRLESQAVAAIVKSQCQKAREDRVELQRLKKQLSLLQVREQSSLTTAPQAIISPGRLSPTVTHHQPSSPARQTDLSKLALPGVVVDKLKGVAHPPSGLQIFQDMSAATNHGEAGRHTPWSMQIPTQQQITQPSYAGFRSKDSDLELISKANKSKLENLEKQRAYLLATGIYNIGDRVIKGLDQEIQMVMSGAS